jgi:hypothetical protein
MIVHVTTFTWVDGVTADDVERLEVALGRLPSVIDVLKGYSFGANLGLRPGTADFVVVALLERPEDVAGYLDHPEHRELLDDLVGPMTAHRQTVHTTWDPVVWPA